jgi:fluoride exporter
VTPVYIALAGSFGAIARFMLDGHIRGRHNHTFPWATLIINSTGSCILGLVSGILLKHHNFKELEAIVGVGFCGGYTTFSTASFETVRLLEQRRYYVALGNTSASLVATILAAAIGVALGQLV